MKGKPRDRIAAQCQLCGKKLTKAGLIGHMAWKHGRDHKAPMVPVDKPMPVGEARRKAHLFDAITEGSCQYWREHVCKEIEAILHPSTRQCAVF